MRLVHKADEMFQCQGTVGLGIPGFVNPATGIAEIVNIRAADHKPIIQDLETRLGVKFALKMTRIVLRYQKLGMKKMPNIQAC